VQLNTNQKSVSRLSRYRNALYRFKSYNAKWVYSEQIASALSITAAQVRKDFSHFGVTGKRKLGYHVDTIIDHLNRILGKTDLNRAIIAGFGPLGKALYNEYFSKDLGFQIVAAFDDDPCTRECHDKNEATGVPLFPFSNLIGFVANNSIKFGVIAIPGKTAQSILDLMVLSGIRGILSFSSSELKSPKKCFVNSINIVREFENVVFFGGNNGNKKRSA
jgi:redox-sensing transcriptional repressor